MGKTDSVEFKFLCCHRVSVCVSVCMFVCMYAREYTENL